MYIHTHTCVYIYRYEVTSLSVGWYFHYVNDIGLTLVRPRTLKKPSGVKCFLMLNIGLNLKQVSPVVRVQNLNKATFLISVPSFNYKFWLHKYHCVAILSVCLSLCHVFMKANKKSRHWIGAVKRNCCLESGVYSPGRGAMAHTVSGMWGITDCVTNWLTV